MSKMKLSYADKVIDVSPNSFAKKIAKAMKKIGSSHVYFIMQQAYGEIDYKDCERIWEIVLKNSHPMN